MPYLQLDLEGGQLFFPTEGKGPNEGLGYCRLNQFSLEIVAVLMLIHPGRDLSGVIIETYQDEDKSNFIFLLGSGISV